MYNSKFYLYFFRHYKIKLFHFTEGVNLILITNYKMMEFLSMLILCKIVTKASSFFFFTQYTIECDACVCSLHALVFKFKKNLIDSLISFYRLFMNFSLFFFCVCAIPFFLYVLPLNGV